MASVMVQLVLKVFTMNKLTEKKKMKIFLLFGVTPDRFLKMGFEGPKFWVFQNPFLKTGQNDPLL